MNFIAENKAKCTGRSIRKSTKEMASCQAGISGLTLIPQFYNRHLDRSHLSSRKARGA